MYMCCVFCTIYVQCERPSLNWGGGLWHQLSATYSAGLRSLPRRFNPRSHLASGDHNRSHGGLGQGLSVLSPFSCFFVLFGWAEVCLQWALMSDGGSVQSMWYNRSVGHCCLCFCWVASQPRRRATLQYIRSWSENRVLQTPKFWLR